jgi:hypothetical protein
LKNSTVLKYLHRKKGFKFQFFGHFVGTADLTFYTQTINYLLPNFILLLNKNLGEWS